MPQSEFKEHHEILIYSLKGIGRQDKKPKEAVYMLKFVGLVASLTIILYVFLAIALVNYTGKTSTKPSSTHQEQYQSRPTMMKSEPTMAQVKFPFDTNPEKIKDTSIWVNLLECLLFWIMVAGAKRLNPN